MTITKQNNLICSFGGDLVNPSFSNPLGEKSLRGFFVLSGKPSERSKDGFTKHLSPLVDCTTAETKFGLCAREYMGVFQPANRTKTLNTHAAQIGPPPCEIVSDENVKELEKSGNFF